MTETEKAQQHLDACVSHNGHYGFPPWLAGLRIALVAVGILESMLAELRAMNENGKTPTRKR